MAEETCKSLRSGVPGGNLLQLFKVMGCTGEQRSSSLTMALNWTGLTSSFQLHTEALLSGVSVLLEGTSPG